MTENEMKLSRRAVLAGATGLVVAIGAQGRGAFAASTGGTGKPAPIAPSTYLRIAPNSSITVVCKHVELGQGIHTGLATLVAEELDANWGQVRVEDAPVDPALYGNMMFGGAQSTGGSTSLRASFDLMRKAGATARAMLVTAAAASWGVDERAIEIANGVISHQASGRVGTFGEFAERAGKLPVPLDAQVKDSTRFTMIGREGATPRIDTVAKVNGSAVYTIDLHEPDMLTAVIVRPPRFGAKPAGFDAVATLKIKGVVAVKQIPSGYAVYARGTWPALSGAEALATRWDESASEPLGSEELIASYLDLTTTRGVTVGENGDVDMALSAASSEEIEEASFAFPFLAHAPMEPINGLIKWTGSSVDVYFPSQLQTMERAALAKALALTPSEVRIHTTSGGGSFGRRGSFSSHFAIELAEVAKAIGPGHTIKMLWPRPTEFLDGYYRPLAVHRMRAVVRNGSIIAWTNSIASQSIIRATPAAAIFGPGPDRFISEGSRDQPYAFPNFRCDVHETSSAITTNTWRAVGHTHTAYAVECFLDMLLQKAGKDPVAGRRELLGGHARLMGVLDAVAKLARWTDAPAPAGRARGVALCESYGTFVAQIAEVSLDQQGNPKVHKVWCAVDCGIAVNPDIIRAQMEGGIGFGMGHALYGEVAVEAGAPKASNLHDYRSLSIADMPEIEVVILPSNEPPSGVGEPGVPPIAPAIANALARLGKDRPARLPMIRT